MTLNLYAATGNALIGDVSVSKLTRLDLASELAGDVTVEHGITDVSSIVAKQMLKKTNVQPDAPKVWIKDGDLKLFQMLGRTDPHETHPPYSELAAMAEGSILQVDAGNVSTIQMGTAASQFIGTIKGVINVSGGSISTIQVENGTITDPTANPATNYRILAKNGIGSITADAIDCDIITNSGNPTTSGLGYIGSLVTNSGDLKGQFTTRGVGLPSSSTGIAAMAIAGDLDGTLDAAEGVRNATGSRAITIDGALTSTSLIRIGDAIAGGGSDGGISVGSGGLDGQVVINANNAECTGSGFWAGMVSVGGTALSHHSDGCDGAYSTHASGLGGGAVGLVPYDLYSADCQPVHYDDWHWTYEHDPAHPSQWPAGEAASPLRLLNSYFCLPTSDSRKQHATIEFYGPVWTGAPSTAVSSLQPYTVWQYVAVVPMHTYVWADVTDSMVVDMARTEAGARRDITITTTASQFQASYFAVTFNGELPGTIGVDRYAIQCAKTFASPAPAPWALEYHFRLYPDCDGNGEVDDTDTYCPMLGGFCYADLTDQSTPFSSSSGTCGYPDGGVDINDLLFFLAGFEAGSTCVDLDNGSFTGTPDGGTDINDLLFYLYHFEAGC